MLSDLGIVISKTSKYDRCQPVFFCVQIQATFECDPSKSVSGFSRNYRVSGQRL